MIGDDGSKELVVRFIDEKVEIRTPILRRYQAARQLDLVLFTDSTVGTQCSVSIKTLNSLSFEEKIDDNLGRISMDVYLSISQNFENHSRLFVKCILPPPPREKCGIWPFKSEQEYPGSLFSYWQPQPH